MASRSNAPLWTGAAAGVLFYLNALVPYSHAWPLLWPLAGGALAVVLAARHQADGLTAGDGLRRGLVAGGVAGLLFFVATVPTLYALSLPRFAHAADLLGATDGPVSVTMAVVAGMAVAGLIGTAAAVFGGMAAVPLARRVAH